MMAQEERKPNTGRQVLLRASEIRDVLYLSAPRLAFAVALLLGFCIGLIGADSFSLIYTDHLILLPADSFALEDLL